MFNCIISSRLPNTNTSLHLLQIPFSITFDIFAGNERMMISVSQCIEQHQVFSCDGCDIVCQVAHLQLLPVGLLFPMLVSYPFLMETTLNWSKDKPIYAQTVAVWLSVNMVNNRKQFHDTFYNGSVCLSVSAY